MKRYWWNLSPSLVNLHRNAGRNCFPFIKMAVCSWDGKIFMFCSVKTTADKLHFMGVCVYLCGCFCCVGQSTDWKTRIIGRRRGGGGGELYFCWYFEIIHDNHIYFRLGSELSYLFLCCVVLSYDMLASLRVRF